jgi:type II secretion system protein I
VRWRGDKVKGAGKAAKKSRLHQGFTLLEVMVSLAILATAFAAALRLHSDSIGVLISTRIHTKAAELAQYKMTEIEMVGLKNLGLRSGEFGELAPDYVWEMRIDDTPSEYWKVVTVHVRNSRGGRAGEFDLSQFMTDKGAIAYFKAQ